MSSAIISSGVIAERAPERGEAADRLVVRDLGERAAVGAGEDDLRRRSLGELPDDPGDVACADVQAVAVVDGDDGRPAAAAEALDGA